MLTETKVLRNEKSDESDDDFQGSNSPWNEDEEESINDKDWDKD